MPPKSIWRGPNTQHFALVHRSQQDPLLYDADASKRVLKAVARQSDRHGDERDDASGSGHASGSSERQPTSRKQLEHDLGTLAAKERENVGEAAEYGIFYDDTDYDYMQHLRPIGGNDNSRRGGKDEAIDADVIMLEAPLTKQQAKAKARAYDGGEIQLKEEQSEARKVSLPAEVLPSEDVLQRTFAENKAEGIRPDLDPHLRQVLEALEDEAFLMRTARGRDVGTDAEAAENDASDEVASAVPADTDEEEDIDDFFDSIVQGGELAETEQQPDWRQLPPEGDESIFLDATARAARELLQLREEGKGVEDLSLAGRLALFKEAQEEQGGDNRDDAGLQSLAHTTGAAAPARRAPSSIASQSIFGEKGASRKSRHPGSKARLAASHYAPSSAGGSTAFSMSSSSMERNKGLTDLDERYERMERIYEDDDEDDEEEDDDSDEDPGEALKKDPRNIEGILDEHLNKHEVVGKRLRERLGTADITSMQKVDLIREELGKLRTIDRQTWDEAEAAGLGPAESVEQLISRDLRARQDAQREFDVETIQTTRTNLAHRPRTITAAQSVAPSCITRIVPTKAGVGDGTESSIDRMPRVKIDPRTGAMRTHGFIKIRGDGSKEQHKSADTASVNADSDSEPEMSGLPAPADATSAEDEDSDGTETEETTGFSRDTSVRRDRHESADAKKERKAAVKAEKQMRRAEKSQRKAQFKEASFVARNKHPVAVMGQSLA